jgi:hypothetical protein
MVEVTFPTHMAQDCSPRELVPLPKVLKAVRTFCEWGAMDPNLDWEEG